MSLKVTPECAVSVLVICNFTTLLDRMKAVSGVSAKHLGFDAVSLFACQDIGKKDRRTCTALCSVQPSLATADEQHSG